MGNYKNIETEFIERTLHLIAQYEGILHRYGFNEQYNYTLLINCLLGLIVLPKEKVMTYLPAVRFTEKLKAEMGLTDSFFDHEIVDLKKLVVQLRHSIAHFDISFESADEEFLIDRIVFRDSEHDNKIIAAFVPGELLNFIRYYGNWVISNIRAHQQGQ
ncbi:HEPN family nuclease [Chryseobacterium culicis]|uniref:HEPN family nuclease n=1 Tax=Chryseobacterium culicis TaxID=680127 RepID=UPI00289FC3D0|nr:HEPN family nuclease [Chryseobacterium culicis]